MKIYKYTTKDKEGRSSTGTLDANTEEEAAAVLHEKGLVVISLKQVKEKKMPRARSKVKLDDLVIFSRQLATLIDAGIPLVQALTILQEQVENKTLLIVVTQVRKDIEAGMSFCDALAKHPNVFSDLFINMVRAGEASGMLDEVLERLAGYMEKAAGLNRKIRSSLVYPAVVVSMAILITGVLLLKVVPTFKGIFEMLGGQLPLPTRVLIGVSDFLRAYFLFAVIAMVGLAFLFKRYLKTKQGRYNFDAFKLKVAVIGPLFRKVAIARFARTFSTLVKSGVVVLTALDIVSKTSGNTVVEEVVASCRNAVRSGEPISDPLGKSKVFPPMVSRMIGVGEKTGKLENMLTKIAEFYEEQVDAAVSALTSMIEPLVIAFLGVIIGGIVIALFLPIFKITELIAA
ncbi:type II secretion system F family protein [Candidatus Omnitrophota bacterium]